MRPSCHWTCAGQLKISTHKHFAHKSVTWVLFTFFRRHSDCPPMRGGPAKCYRHYSRRKVTQVTQQTSAVTNNNNFVYVFQGICVASIDHCDTKEDCVGKGKL